MCGKRITMQMGLTPKVFNDTIVNASLPYQVQADPPAYHLTHELRSIDIRLTAESPRVIAGLSLPVTRVEIEFHQHTQEQIDAYMERFMKYFHRGGG